MSLPELSWPENTLGSPRLNGYTVPVLSPIVSDTLQGPTQTRRNVQSIRLRLPYNWSSDQLNTFDDWYEANQAHWFQQTLKFGVNRLPVAVRIYDVTPYKKSGLNWDVTVIVECRASPVISDGAANLLLSMSASQLNRMIEQLQAIDELVHQHNIPDF